MDNAEEQLRLLLGAVKDYAIITLDTDGNVTTWNSGAERIKGYTAEEIVGQHFSRFYPDEDVKAGKPGRELVEAARVGKLEDEGWRIRKDGSRFWANVLITALRDEEGRLRGFGKVTRDITERKHSEDAIRALNQQLVQRDAERTASNAGLAEQKRLVERLLQKLSDMGVGLMRSSGGTAESFNDAFARMTGYGPGQGPVPPLAKLIAPEYLDQFREQLAARVAGMGDVVILEWEIIARDGRRIPVESISRSELIDGQQHSIAIVLDITERKRAEQELIESQARLQAIIDTSLTAIVTMNDQGVITDWNPQAEVTFGWPRKDVLGRILVDTIIPPEYRD